jgi:hypothetical protein
MLVNSVVVADDHRRAALSSDRGIELMAHPGSRQRRVGDCDALPGEIIHDSQDAEASTVGQRVADEIQ